MEADIVELDGQIGLWPSSAGYALGYAEPMYHRGLVAVGGRLEESLSVSGAKLLVPPSTPAHFRGHIREASQAFDEGHAAHQLLLGVGAPIEPIPFDDWRTKAAREAADAARAAGCIPLKTDQYERVCGMADALSAHETASDLLTGRGWPEVSMWAPDGDIGVWLRGRADYINFDAHLIVDYKTTASPAHPEGAAKTIWKFHYEMQAAWYIDLAQTVGLDVDGFVFVFQEKAPPYAVSVVRLDDAAMETGRAENAAAIRLYAACIETDTWPGYADQIETIALPRWATAAWTPDIGLYARLEDLIKEMET